MFSLFNGFILLCCNFPAERRWSCCLLAGVVRPRTYRGLGSNPHRNTVLVQVTAEWRKISHIILRSPVNHFSDTGQRERRVTAWVKQVTHHGSRCKENQTALQTGWSRPCGLSINLSRAVGSKNKNKTKNQIWKENVFVNALVLDFISTQPIISASNR